MRTEGSPELLETLRRKAIAGLRQGYDAQEVADLLEVHISSVYRWRKQFESGGMAALAAVAVSGRPLKLTGPQARRVLCWVREKDPTHLGFDTPRWTARRLAALIEDRMGVRFNVRYLNHWLSRRSISPQIPDRRPRERDQAAVDHWIRCDWPRIKKGLPKWGRPSYLPTKQAF